MCVWFAQFHSFKGCNRLEHIMCSITIYIHRLAKLAHYTRNMHAMSIISTVNPCTKHTKLKLLKHSCVVLTKRVV